MSFYFYQLVEQISVGCDPVDSCLVATIETGCDPLDELRVKTADKFTHMETQKTKSVAVATEVTAFMDASTSTNGDGSFVESATQAEVIMKDKGTSCKVRD